MMMVRRPHRKSRRGCSECKRRHIRCDEQRPSCRNCTRSERECSYPPGQNEPVAAGPPSSDEARAASGSGANTPVSADGFRTMPPAASASFGGSPGVQSINMVHLELMSNFITNFHQFFNVRKAHEARGSVLEAAFAHPFLMYEMLAFSARHLSAVKGAATSAFYRDQAMVLQTRGLDLYNASTLVPGADNCVAVFLFSNFLGMHLLSDMMAERDARLGDFLERFLVYHRIHRGVRVVTQSSWQLLLESSMGPLLRWGAARYALDPRGHECDDLLDLVGSAHHMGPESVDVCSRGVRQLQVVFDCAAEDAADRERNGGGGAGDPRTVFSWPPLLGDEWTALLGARTPEAIVMLAYFGVLLHQSRDLWSVGGGGRHLVNLIAEYLGPSWAPWLEWPCKVVNAEGTPPPPPPPAPPPESR